MGLFLKTSWCFFTNPDLKKYAKVKLDPISTRFVKITNICNHHLVFEKGLVGGFNPSEKYYPNVGVKIKNI